MVKFEYDGYAYVRPVSRGVVMIENPYQLYVEEAVPDGYYRLKVSFEPLTAEETKRAKEML